jgi:hypothetical protein
MSLTQLAPLIVGAGEGAEKSGPPGWAYGIFTGAVLLALLAITLIFGKGRPHS